RLEMGTKMPNERAEDLYGFWGSSIAESLVADMRAAGTKVLVNLASKEYFSSVNTEVLAHAGVRVLEPVFKDYKSGTYKVVSFFAKRARGLMASHIVRHRLTDPEALRGFIEAGYTWNAERSSPDQPVFLRRQE
ncbi:MAG: peroxide stress protein YaaA, partial [Myxococcota bacterium]